MNVTLSPEMKRFVDARIRTGLCASAGEVVREALRLMAARDRMAQALPSWRVGAETDVDALAILIAQQMAQEADNDLRALMAEMRARDAAKKALRELVRRVKRDRLANETRREYAERLDCSQGLGSERAYRRVKLPALDAEAAGGLRWVATDLAGGRLTRVEQLDGIVDELRDRLDSLSDTAALDMLRLQMLMERRAKAIEMLSNMMKIVSDTQAALTQNLK